MIFALPVVLLLSVGIIYLNSGIINQINQSEKMGLFNYQIYSVYNDQKVKNKLLTINEDRLDQSIINDLKGIEELDVPEYFGIAKDKNILVVQLESLQTFPIDLEINGNMVTPTLNRLIEDSYYFPNVYQQIGKGNTSDAEFALNTSIYPLGGRAMSQEFGNREIPSLPKILKEHDYASATFHTNDIQFWYRDRMYEALGFDQYFDKSFFGNEDIIAFGASDEVLYEKSLPILEAITKQGGFFYANLIAMSSHHPYTLPDSKKMLELPSKYQDTAVGNYLVAIHYADYALEQLVENLKARGLWEETLLFVYGDHFGLRLETNEDEKLMEDILGRAYHQHVDHFKTPLIVSVPGEEENSQTFEHIGGQVDFMPTLLNLVGIKNEESIMFGQDLFNYETNLLGMRFYLPTGSFINDDILFSPGDSFDDGQAVDQTTLEDVENIEQYQEDFQRLTELLELSDAYVTHLPTREGLENINFEFVLDGSLQWEHFSNGDDYKVVRVNLFSPSITKYKVEKENQKLENINANNFDDSNLYDFYGNGYLYLSIDNTESNWTEDKLSTQNISRFFDQNNYTLYLYEDDYNKINRKLSSYNEIIKEVGEKIELNDELNWEHFSNHQDYKVVRVQLNVPQTNYFVDRNKAPLTDGNADYFDRGDLSDLYANGYLYLSINAEDSQWTNESTPTVAEIKTYFKEQNYLLYLDTRNEILK